MSESRKNVPLVSVIMPVYNCADYLEESLGSLRDQTLESLEVVVVDDGSTDNSREVIKRFCVQYPGRFTLLTKENGGQGSARNLGLDHATGEYIGFMDADDLVLPMMYEKMFVKAKIDDSDRVECGWIPFADKDGEQICGTPFIPIRKYEKPAEKYVGIGTEQPRHIYRASCIKESGAFFPETRAFEDTGFHLMMLPFMKRIAIVPEALCMFRRREASTMFGMAPSRLREYFKVFDSVRAFCSEHEVSQDDCDGIEYASVRILLCSSIGLAHQFELKAERRSYIKDSLEYIRENYPSYKTNPLFVSGGMGFYLRHANYATCSIAQPVIAAKVSKRRGTTSEGTK